MKAAKNIFKKATAFVSAFAFMPFIALAEEAEESVDGFYYLEIIGAITAVASFVVMLQVAKASKGGMFEKTFKLYAVAFALFTFSVLWRGFGEMFGVEEGFMADLIFEAPLYIGFILALIGSRGAKKALTSIG